MLLQLSTILFTALGIPAYGIREIARIRDNIFERTKLVLELGIILLVNTIIGFLSLEEETAIQSNFGNRVEILRVYFIRRKLNFSEKDKNRPSFLEFEKRQKEEKVLILGAERQLGKEFQKFFQK